MNRSLSRAESLKATRRRKVAKQPFIKARFKYKILFIFLFLSPVDDNIAINYQHAAVNSSSQFAPVII
jgi:hypothetical protein